jgi:hypothetical protein
MLGRGGSGRGRLAVPLAVGLAVAAIGAGSGSPSTAGLQSGPGPALGTRVDVEDAPNAPTIAQAMADAHVDGVGIYLPWNDIEPNPPSIDGTHIYRWEGSPFDDTVNALKAAGVDILTVRVVIPPEWAVKGGDCHTTACPPTPAHYDDFRAFVEAAIQRYGPGGSTGADIQHWSLWNEPNKAFEWGNRRTGTFKQYSNLLVQFHAAATAASDQVSVDAGEIAAGGANGQNAPRAWAKGLHRYSNSKGRDGDYDVVTIHAYSQRASDVAAKVRAYQRLFKGHPVAVTEFGWSVGASHGSGSWKCVPNEQTQATRFRNAVHAVQTSPGVGEVPWLIWFAGIDDDLADDPHPKPPKCRANSWYQPKVRKYIDSFGLYMRTQNGSASQLFPRAIVGDFSSAAQ